MTPRLSSMYLLRLRDDSLVPLHQNCRLQGGAPRQVAWAADGSTLAVVCDGQDWLISVDDARIRPMPAPSSSGVLVSADGSDVLRFLIRREDGEIVRSWTAVDVRTGASRELPSSVRDLDPFAVSWRPRP